MLLAWGLCWQTGVWCLGQVNRASLQLPAPQLPITALVYSTTYVLHVSGGSGACNICPCAILLLDGAATV
jgi:hypothetical protein